MSIYGKKYWFTGKKYWLTGTNWFTGKNIGLLVQKTRLKISKFKHLYLKKKEEA